MVAQPKTRISAPYSSSLTEDAPSACRSGAPTSARSRPGRSGSPEKTRGAGWHFGRRPRPPNKSPLPPSRRWGPVCTLGRSCPWHSSSSRSARAPQEHVRREAVPREEQRLRRHRSLPARLGVDSHEALAGKELYRHVPHLDFCLRARAHQPRAAQGGILSGDAFPVILEGGMAMGTAQHDHEEVVLPHQRRAVLLASPGSR